MTPTATRLHSMLALSVGVLLALGSGSAMLHAQSPDPPAAGDGPALTADDPAVQAQVDAATQKALDFLAKTQNPNGYWPTGYGKNVAITSLACMAFVACGHLPGQGPYGKTLDKALDWLLEQQLPNGLIAAETREGGMYDHGMATLLLGEIAGMVPGERGERVRTAARKAIRLILDAQAIQKRNADMQGGWRYTPGANDSDISVSGWQLMALKAAKSDGADVPDEAIADAVEYIRRSAVSGGGFSYQPGKGGPNGARTGIGILCLEIAGRHLLPKGSDHWPESLAGGQWLLNNPLRRWDGEHLYYSIYYTTVGMWQLGGKYWASYWPSLRKMILANQKPDGSWPLEGGSGGRAGSAYSTAMCTLALAIEYKLLPIYQR